MPAAKRKPIEAVPPPEGDDPRGKLAAAILEEAVAKKAIELKLAAIRRALDGTEAAEKKLEECKAAVAKAREVDAQSAATHFEKSGKPDSPWHLRRALSDIEIAESTLEVTDRAHKKLRDDLAALEDDAAEAKNGVLVAMREVTVPLAMELMIELAQLRRRTSICVRALSDLMADDARTLPTFHDQMRDLQCANKRAAVFSEIKDEAARLLYGASNEDHEAGLKASKEMKAALAELMQTPEHPLPKV